MTLGHRFRLHIQEGYLKIKFVKSCSGHRYYPLATGKEIFYRKLYPDRNGRTASPGMDASISM